MCFIKANYLVFADKVDFFNVPQHLSIYKIGSQNNLQLPNGVPTHMFFFPEQHGATQKSIQITNKLVQEEPLNRDSALTMETAYNFMNEEF